MLSNMRDITTPEHLKKVVDSVIKAAKTKNGLPKDALDFFRDTIPPVRGHNRDPFKAPIPMLMGSINRKLEQMPEYADLLTKIWTETQPKLHELMQEYFEDLSPPFDADNPTETLFAFADEQATAFREQHNEYDEDDVRLMARWTAIMESSQRQGDAAPLNLVDDISNTQIVDFVNKISLLPANDAVWDDDIHTLLLELTRLSDVKREERSRTAELHASLEEVKRSFGSELAFFNQQTDSWDAAAASTSEDIAEAVRLLAEINTSLEAYKPIMEAAPNIAEERIRRQQRHDLEDTIEPLVTRVHSLLHIPPASDDTQPDATDPADAHVLDSAAFQALQAENQTLLQANENLHAKLISLSKSFETIQADIHEVRGELDGLRLDKQTLQDELAELNGTLTISRSNELYWRNAYDEEMQRKDSDAPTPIPLEIESIAQAIDLAESRFKDTLVISLNKKSDTSNFYRNPKEVWDALEWLATTYYRSQTGEERVIDLAHSLREACSNWEYAPGQTDITINTYPEWYTTTVDGVPYALRKHIGKGRIRSDRNIIRIAFEWDEQFKRVVVGFIGRHQRNRNS